MQITMNTWLQQTHADYNEHSAITNPCRLQLTLSYNRPMHIAMNTWLQQTHADYNEHSAITNPCRLQ